MFVIGSVPTTWLFWCNLSYCWTVCEILKTPSSSLLCRFIWHRHHFPFLHSRLFLGIFSRTHFSTRSSSCYTSDLVRILMHRISKTYAKPTLQRSSIANNMTAMPHLNWKYLHNVVHKCAIPARVFLILSWDRKVSRYFGIVLILILNFENLGISIDIGIEFGILRYWYWYWYPFLNFEVLVLILVLN